MKYVSREESYELWKAKIKYNWWRFSLVSHYKWFPSIGIEMDLYMKIFTINLIFAVIIFYYGKIDNV